MGEGLWPRFMSETLTGTYSPFFFPASVWVSLGKRLAWPWR